MPRNRGLWVRLMNTVAHCEEVRTRRLGSNHGVCRLYSGPCRVVLWVKAMSLKAEWKKTGIHIWGEHSESHA